MTLATTGLARLQPPENEIVRLYAPDTVERAKLQSTLRTLAGERIELPLVIDGREVATGRLEAAVMPHTHRHVLADAHLAEAAEHFWP